MSGGGHSQCGEKKKTKENAGRTYDGEHTAFARILVLFLWVSGQNNLK